MESCNSVESTFDGAAILIGSQRDSFAAVAHCPVDPFFRGATVKEIPLTQGKVALVDDEDYEYATRFKWVAHRAWGTWYCERTTTINGRDVSFKLHRVLMNAPKGLEVDHRNGDGLDNRRQNLRLATRIQNGFNRRKPKNNTSGYKGVTSAYGGKWEASVSANKIRHHLGVHLTPEDAARAYDRAAKQLHGEFARLNFPEEAAQ